MKMNEKIRNYIETRGMIMKVVANRAGIEQKKFYRLVNGHTGMTVEEYEAICKKGLEVDPSIFFKQNFSLSEKNKTA